jgi:hypothetical protein
MPDFGSYSEGPLARTIRDTFRYRSEAERHSAIVARLFQLKDRLLSDGGEPIKPPVTVDWPADLDEQDPSIRYPRLPLQLNRIIADLDSARESLARIHSELVVSSFVWLARDGMRVDMEHNPGIYRFLNETFWPMKYSLIRRMADFQNRVFANYAREHGLPFVDLARHYPMEPALFGDAIHMTDEGVRLQGWIVLQELIPIIRQRLARGTLPRRDPSPPAVHPAFAVPAGRMVTRAELLAACGRQQPASRASP